MTLWSSQRWSVGRPSWSRASYTSRAGNLRFVASPSLEDIRSRVHFTCKENQGNDRPLLNRRTNDRRTRGRLFGRPMNPPPLKWRGVEGSVQSLADHLSGQMPLPMRVELRLMLGGIEHNPENYCPRSNDQCWCTSRCLDKASLPTALITSLIRTSLSQGRSSSGRETGDLQAITAIPTP